jgi:hypothetical protein
LKPDQTDQDSLPPYEVLDAIVRAYMEEDRSPREIIAAGLPEAACARRPPAAHRRIQAPPGAGRHPHYAAWFWQGLAVSYYQSLSRRILRNLNQEDQNMKKIEAIIKPFKLDEVREALSESVSPA